MNNIDAAKILNISGELTKEIIKRAYRVASSLYHPDRNSAGLQMMQMVNEAYQVLKDFTGCVEGVSEAEAENQDYGFTLSEALQSIINLDGLDVEICGSWVWVTGDTKAHKAILNEAGFKWASKKVAWYLRPEGDRAKYRGKCSLDDIRERHGSQRAKSYRKNIAA
jgi:hypothetical protein